MNETASANSAVCTPAAGDDDAGDRRAAGGPDRERDVEQRVALAKLPGRGEDRGRRGSGQRPRRRGDRAVERGERQNRDEREVLGDQREDRERDRLGRVQAREAEAHGGRFEPRDQRRPEHGGGEVHAAKQRRGRHRAPGLVEDQDRERDLAEPVARTR